MHYLGIDYGKKRIGLSFADELHVAYPLPPILCIPTEERLAHLERIIAARKVHTLVIGYPYQLDGQVGTRGQEVEAFIGLVSKRFELPVHRHDERYTTLQAEADWAHHVKSKRLTVKQLQAERKTGALDSRAATLILQDFLESQLLGLL